MARNISIKIIGDSRSYERALKRAGSATDSFGKKMRKALTGRTAKIGLGVGAAGLGGGLVGIGFAMRRGFNEIADSQKVLAQTSAVLRSTGNAANVSANKVVRLSESLARMSGIDDEAIQGLENILLTFTGIKNEAGEGNNIFDQATKATLDMSTALGMDLNNAAIMVGKALNQMDVTSQGNVRGFMALRRVGVLVTPQMMKLAAALIRAGKPMEAQKLLLQELKTEFGGSAKAFGTTMPGALGKLSNAFDEVAAAFASGFLPLITKVAKQLTTKLADPKFVNNVRQLGTLIGDKLYNAFKVVGAWFVRNWPTIQAGFRITAKILGALVTVIRRIRIAVLEMYQGILTAISGIVEIFSHLPGFLGGGKFQSAKKSINAAREGNRAQLRSLMDKERASTVTNVDLYMDSEKVGSAVTKRQQRKKKSSSGSRRGRSPSPGLLHH